MEPVPTSEHPYFTAAKQDQFCNPSFCTHQCRNCLVVDGTLPASGEEFHFFPLKQKPKDEPLPGMKGSFAKPAHWSPQGKWIDEVEIRGL